MFENIFKKLIASKITHKDLLSFKFFKNFNNFSCLIFMPKCASTPKPKNTPRGQTC